MNFSTVAAIVLAAGSSARMGKPKQLIEFEGQSLLRRTVETVIASSVDFVVVTTADNGVDFARELSGLDWTAAQVEKPEQGQSESVRAGLSTVEEYGDFDAILFTPCDLPLLSIEHLDALLAKYRRGDWDIVASRYDGIAGAPLIIGRTLWPEIWELRGDTGMRKILPSRRASTLCIEWEDGKFDLDTPEDVEALLNRRRIME